MDWETKKPLLKELVKRCITPSAKRTSWARGSSYKWRFTFRNLSVIHNDGNDSNVFYIFIHNGVDVTKALADLLKLQKEVFSKYDVVLKSCTMKKIGRTFVNAYWRDSQGAVVEDHWRREHYRIQEID